MSYKEATDNTNWEIYPDWTVVLELENTNCGLSYTSSPYGYESDYKK